MPMVRVQNISDGPVVVGEKYLDPGESRLLDSGWAALILAQNPARLAGSPVNPPVGEEAFWDGEEPPRPGDGVTVGLLPTAAKDNLRAIQGIGARIAEALTVLGVNSYTDLAGADAVWLAAALDGSSQAQVERWQAQARRLLERLDE